jgi:hypothetical protein
MSHNVPNCCVFGGGGKGTPFSCCCCFAHLSYQKKIGGPRAENNSRLARWEGWKEGVRRMTRDEERRDEEEKRRG